jgi:hypothetical protein
LFDTETNVHYSGTWDEFSVKATHSNVNIYEKFCVRGEFRKYDGLALMKHALHNTTPNISKSAKATIIFFLIFPNNFRTFAVDFSKYCETQKKRRAFRKSILSKF